MGRLAARRRLQRYVSTRVGADPLGLAPQGRRQSRTDATSPADYGWVEMAIPMGMPAPLGAVAQGQTPGGDTIYVLQGWSQGGGQAGHVEKTMLAWIANRVTLNAAPTAVGPRILRLYTERRPCQAGANPCHPYLTNALHGTTPVLWTFAEAEPEDWLALRDYQRRALVDVWTQNANNHAVMQHGQPVPAHILQAIAAFRYEIDAATTQFLMQGRDPAWMDTWLQNQYLPHASLAIRILFGLALPVVAKGGKLPRPQQQPPDKGGDRGDGGFGGAPVHQLVT
jgi:hypothetical protein